MSALDHYYFQVDACPGLVLLPGWRLMLGLVLMAVHFTVMWPSVAENAFLILVRPWLAAVGHMTSVTHFRRLCNVYLATYFLDWPYRCGHDFMKSRLDAVWSDLPYTIGSQVTWPRSVEIMSLILARLWLAAVGHVTNIFHFSRPFKWDVRLALATSLPGWPYTCG